MSTLRIDLDEHTAAALTSIASTRGATTSDLDDEIVADYVKMRESRRWGDPAEHDRGGPDPLDARVGSIEGAPADDVDEVIYGR